MTIIDIVADVMEKRRAIYEEKRARWIQRDSQRDTYEMYEHSVEAITLLRLEINGRLERHGYSERIPAPTNQAS